MSMSEVDLSQYKTFRQISRDRLLSEMLGSVESTDSSWKILIMDKVTVKVMGMSCKMADITDHGVSLVEEVFKRREPMPSMQAIYFMQPIKENVIMLLSDMSGRCPLYKKAYVFFSTPVAKELTNYVKNDPSIIPRIGALREMNLEYFAVDNQAFVTDHEMAMEELYGANAGKTSNECLNTMALRIATAIASLKELPNVRYRAAKSTNSSGSADDPNLVPKKLAHAVWDILSKYKASVPDYPKKETCDLLILDRSTDQIAPVIHEWTYDCMIHDLLDLDGNKYTYEAPRPGGAVEKKECLLDESDPVWLELRHTHIADASERLHEKMSTFVAKNKAAQFQQSARDGGEVSTKDLQKMVQSLPQYTEQMDRLSLHVEIAGKINTIIREEGLRDLGQLEQDLVFGDAGSKEVLNLLRAKQDASPEDKLRLLMIYAMADPEKFEGDKGVKLMQLAKLSPEDMKVISNMMYLGQVDPTKTSEGGGFSLKFDNKKNAKKHPALRKEKEEEEAWALLRFYPVMEEVVKKLDKGELSKEEYPYVGEQQTNAPAPQQGRASAGSTSSRPVRSRRTATWAKSRGSDDGFSNDSALKNASATDFKKMGQRIFVFIIGGATRSELRVTHTLTAKLKREIVLGTTSMIQAPHFITKLKMLTRQDA